MLLAVLAMTLGLLALQAQATRLSSLVDGAWRFRKDAFLLWRAWWQREPVVHLANRRASVRRAGPVIVNGLQQCA